MLPVYERMTREGKIGPSMMVDGTLVPRPHQEYPKWVTAQDGSRHLVDGKSAELRLIAEKGVMPPVEEVLEEEAKAAKLRAAAAESERDALAQKLVEMQKQLDALKTVGLASGAVGSKGAGK